MLLKPSPRALFKKSDSCCVTHTSGCGRDQQKTTKNIYFSRNSYREGYIFSCYTDLKMLLSFSFSESESHTCISLIKYSHHIPQPPWYRYFFAMVCNYAYCSSYNERIICQKQRKIRARELSLKQNWVEKQMLLFPSLLAEVQAII